MRASRAVRYLKCGALRRESGRLLPRTSPQPPFPPLLPLKLVQTYSTRPSQLYSLNQAFMPPYISESNAQDIDSDLESALSSQTPSPAPPDPHTSKHKSKKKEREMKLRADALADVQSPTLVHCLNCGAAIKLSLKSEYDTSHWVRHRTRCLRRSKVQEAVKFRTPAPASSSESSTRSSPASSARALTPHDDEDVKISAPHTGITIADLLDAPRDDYYEYSDWRSWDWSQLKSRFAMPKD
ncbi:hypothetical protein B0H10DRAFT_1127251 [Mycena sp. CBHHK59/15]|nr:hypothetical protein B0H10DRAFT_1127251 [Mycena sp. CBHHK59/15]